VHLVGFVIRIYHDARSRERPKELTVYYNAPYFTALTCFDTIVSSSGSS